MVLSVEISRDLSAGLPLEKEAETLFQPNKGVCETYEEILSDRCDRCTGRCGRCRREKELDEYERLLFGDDDAETVEPEAPAEAPAEDAAE